MEEETGADLRENGRVWVTPGAQSLNYGDGGLRGEPGLVQNKLTFHLHTFNFYIPNKCLPRLNHGLLKEGKDGTEKEATSD